MGVYLYGPEAAFSNATHQLGQVLDGITSGAATAADKLLFISSQPRKFLCKQRPAGAASSAALPVCEFKLAPVLSGFSVMTCRYVSTAAGRSGLVTYVLPHEVLTSSSCADLLWHDLACMSLTACPWVGYSLATRVHITLHFHCEASLRVW